MFTRQQIKFDTHQLHELYCIGEAENDEVEIETDLLATLAITSTSFPSITKIVYGRKFTPPPLSFDLIVIYEISSIGRF